MALAPELVRLEQEATRKANWKRWGPYLSERQWGTVREDYSADGRCWDYFSHDHARSRAYRWGEDGLLGICDRQCRVCFALALWNEKDPILKERLFGLTNSEGNHGEDCKEYYFYLDSTPTHSYMRALYKYPQRKFPYGELVARNRDASKTEPEFELYDTSAFADSRYFDVFAEYAKASTNDVLIRITIINRGPEHAHLHVLPTLWFRNSWSWGCTHEGCEMKPHMRATGPLRIEGLQATLGGILFEAGPEVISNDPTNQPLLQAPELLFTENETNAERLFSAKNATPYVKDSFHTYLINGKSEAVNPKKQGTKAAVHYALSLAPGEKVVLKMRLRAGKDAEMAIRGGAGHTSANLANDANPRTVEPAEPPGSFDDFDFIFADRMEEADEFYNARIPQGLGEEERLVARQAYAGLLWSRQFYHYVIPAWLNGDPDQPPPPLERKTGRNADWSHLFNRDVISMPDKWEYPWYAAWDLAFHMIPMSTVDPYFAKQQLILFLREWYMHPNGQLPAYEFAFSDVNPPVHAWACWRVYKMTGAKGHRDRQFLARVFQKLLINFTWWVNRKDVAGKHIFAGGFLGLDNIGLFDRSRPLPTGRHMEQADGTAWMAFYCSTMLSMALELAKEDPTYEDVASKFFEHFVAIADAMNTLGGTGLWDETDGFYYDQLHLNSSAIPLRIRSLVGLIPLVAVEILEEGVIDRLPGFKQRMDWFLENRKDLARHISYFEHRTVEVAEGSGSRTESMGHFLLAIPSRQRLACVLKYMLDESEFLSPYGIRSLSAIHREHPYILSLDGQEHCVRYVPAESDTNLFGGNSNWRGPIWFPLNFLIVEALQRYHHFYGDSFTVECPTGSGRHMNLLEAAQEIERRLTRIFLPDENGRRPCHGHDPLFQSDPFFKDLLQFHEYFHGDTGRGVGASHQTGWTALVARTITELFRHRAGEK